MPTTRTQQRRQQEPTEAVMSETDSDEVLFPESNVDRFMTTESNVDKLLTKLSEVTHLLTGISDNVSKLTDYFGISTDGNSQNVTLSSLVSNVKDVLDNINSQAARSQETDNTYLENEAAKVKQSIIQLWNRNLANRKRHFWQKLRNENLAATYEQWRNSTPIVLPRKFQIKQISNEPEDQRRKRERQVLDNFRTERELLELRSQSHMQHVETIDEEMSGIIADKCSGQRRQMLLKLWTEDVKREEEISQQTWDNKNKSWLIKYEHEFQTKYQSKNPFFKDRFDDDSPSDDSQMQRQTVNRRETRRINPQRPEFRETGQPYYRNTRNPGYGQTQYRSYSDAVNENRDRPTPDYNQRVTYIGSQTNNGYRNQGNFRRGYQAPGSTYRRNQEYEQDQRYTYRQRREPRGPDVSDTEDRRNQRPAEEHFLEQRPRRNRMR